MTKITAAGYMKPAGYIIQDKQGYAIFGAGDTVEQAWQQAMEAGPFFDAFGNEKDPDAAYIEDFQTYGATAALIAKVQAEGGAIAWDVIQGVACTNEEAERVET